MMRGPSRARAFTGPARKQKVTAPTSNSVCERCKHFRGDHPRKGACRNSHGTPLRCTCRSFVWNGVELNPPTDDPEEVTAS
ncbi:hypothetical protein PBI_THONKO_52 [Mycobacterium phage Thonko]|uniref:Uncharacterized protein n=1 Tax=Mycobacterium phage Thonko TaxID=2282910 RepID=A0A346FC99_9CAUD|nr:hypothetical protein I5G57_gp052 [Mycobacterium phage Thonko]AXN53324.1 hypothetical protein PBI_THONKO_52 [Mycobacterium phage Thonko]